MVGGGCGLEGDAGEERSHVSGPHNLKTEARMLISLLRYADNDGIVYKI